MLINVDFTNKAVVNKPEITKEQVEESLRVLGILLDTDWSKEEHISANALQILAHDIEDASDETIEEFAVSGMKKMRALRQNRRKIKELSELKEFVSKGLQIGKIRTALNIVCSKNEKFKNGSADKFFSGCEKRKDIEKKEVMKNARLGGCSCRDK